MTETFNKQKFEIFLEVAANLNKFFQLTPILYGSLGLCLAVGGHTSSVGDINILIPDEYLKEKYQELSDLLKKMEFNPKDGTKKEFIREGEVLNFRGENSLKESGISIEQIKISNIKGIQFRELTPRQFLEVYKYYDKADSGKYKEKIELLNKYLTPQN